MSKFSEELKSAELHLREAEIIARIAGYCNTARRFETMVRDILDSPRDADEIDCDYEKRMASR